jgi:hypothetical protein
VRSDAATVTAAGLMTCPDACYQAARSYVPSVVVLDIVGSNRSLGSLAPVACTAARYSNLCALRLPLADIHIRSGLRRSTATRVVPLVCIQVAWQPSRGKQPGAWRYDVGTGFTW